MDPSSYKFNFNSYLLENSDNINIEDVQGLGRVSSRISQDETTGADGGNVWNTLRSMREISVSGNVYADELTSYYDIRDAMANALTFTDNYMELVITRSDGQQKAIDAKIVQLPDFKESAGESADADFNVVWRCPDPLFRDLAVTQVTLTPLVFGGTPVPSPVASPVGVASGLVVATNSGDVAVTPDFEIYGQCLNPTVRNLTTGQMFTINAQINSGEILYIYTTTAGTVIRLNNLTTGSSYFAYLTGDIWQLAKGANTLAFSASSYDTAAHVVVKYYNKYHSI
jgi:hypothetical protein